MFLHSKGCGTGKLILAVSLIKLSKVERFFLDSFHVTLIKISLMDQRQSDISNKTLISYTNRTRNIM